MLRPRYRGTGNGRHHGFRGPKDMRLPGLLMELCLGYTISPEDDHRQECISPLGENL